MTTCNLDYLNKMTSNNPAVISHIIRLFLENTPKSIERIKNGIKTSNWPEVHESSHKMKPTIEMLGLPSDLTQIILTINEAAKTETNTNQIKPLIDTFEKALNKIYIELEELLLQLE